MDKPLLHSTNAQGISTLTLNRPQVHNAFDEFLIAQLNDVLQELASTGQTRVLVLQSTGKNFSAGADLNWMKKTANYSTEENQRDAKALADMLHRLDEFPATTIAKAKGAAFGGGVGLLACCDIAIASTNCVFSLSEVKLGLIPGTISPFVLKAIGSRQARRLFLTGERFDSDYALNAGLVHEVVADEALDQHVDGLMQQLLAGGPQAQRQAKVLIRDIAALPDDTDVALETAKRIANIRATKEAQEGISAFLNKRKANWIPDV